MLMEKAYELVTMNLRYDEFNSFETVHKFYRESEPTTRKVLRLLKADLKRYIRGLDKVFLLTFLHFVTGTNIVSNIHLYEDARLPKTTNNAHMLTIA